MVLTLIQRGSGHSGKLQLSSEWGHLHYLLQKNTKCLWGSKQGWHYAVRCQLIVVLSRSFPGLSASLYEIGFILWHKMGSYSQSHMPLNLAVTRYTQLEKGGFAIVRSRRSTTASTTIFYGNRRLLQNLQHHTNFIHCWAFKPLCIIHRFNCHKLLPQCCYQVKQFTSFSIFTSVISSAQLTTCDWGSRSTEDLSVEKSVLCRFVNWRFFVVANFTAWKGVTTVDKELRPCAWTHEFQPRKPPILVMILRFQLL